MERKWFRWVFIAVSVLTALATAGWISNADSKADCQQQVGLLLVTQSIRGQAFYLLDPNEDEDLRSTFKSIGAKYSVLATNSDDPTTWPRLSMKARTYIPFIISVEYFWEREAEIGGGATRWFICFFGCIVEIGETNEYAT